MVHCLTSALAQRLESAHADSGRQWTTGMPEAAILEIAGGVVVFGTPIGGQPSPVTQALGLGMNGPLSSEDIDIIEDFFRSRQSPSILDLATLADASVLHLAQTRGYVAREFTHVLMRDLVDLPPIPGSIEIEEVKNASATLWVQTVARGFLESDEVPEEFSEMMSGCRGWAEMFLARRGDDAIGGAAMAFHRGVASLVGDSTIVRERGAGVQGALIAHRLRRAANAGCDLASVAVSPGSGSERNYARAGFRLAYARVNLMRSWPSS